MRRWVAASAPEWRPALLLFLAAAAVGMVYYGTLGGTPQFWQNTTFMQAIMWVCGHGFENPMVSDVPGLEAFLNSEVDCFDCAQIPDEVRVLPRDTSGMTFEEIDAYHPWPEFPSFIPWQKYHLYLVLCVLLLWKVFNVVCWAALAPLVGMLYGATTAIGYGLFRLTMGRTLSFVMAVLLMISPMHIEMAPQIRDYAKAPFMLVAMLLMGALIKYAHRGSVQLLLSALCGATIGVGIGFRTDVAIVAPAFIVVALFLFPGHWFKTLHWRLLAIIVFGAAFVGAGWPILMVLAAETGHFAHVALLGFLQYCDGRLGVGANLYHLGDPFSDFYVANTVQSYMHRVHGSMPEMHVMTPEYHAATNLYLMDYVKHFPGDIITRAYAAVLRILNEIHPTNLLHPYPTNITNTFLHRIFDARSFLVDNLPGGGVYYAAAALVLVAVHNFRWAFGALFLLLFFGGYPGIQFNLRHFFYLEIFALWTTGLLVQHVLTGISLPVRAEARAAWVKRLGGPMQVTIRAFGFAILAGLCIVIPVMSLELVQHKGTLEQLIRRTSDATLEPLAWQLSTSSGTEEKSTVDIGLPGFADYTAPPSEQVGLATYYEYLVVELRGGDTPVPVTFRYEADDAEHFDYSRTVVAPVSSGNESTRLYFPLYYSAAARFQGISLPAELLSRVVGFHRVATADGNEIPIWLTLTLPPNWEQQWRFQSLRR